METRAPSPSWPIRWKFSTVFTVIVGLISVFIYFFFPARLERQAMAALSDKAETIGGMLAFGAAPTLFFNDPQAAEQVLESARQSEDLAYLVVLHESGKVAASWNEEAAARAQYARSERQAVSPDRSILTEVVPVVFRGRQVGTLYLGLSLDAVKAEVAESRRAVAAVSLLVFLLGVLGVLALSTLITRPLNAMVLTVHQIAGGDLSRRATAASRDEVGILGGAFNRMVDSLVSAQDALRHLNEGLEARVRDRTLELEREVRERRLAQAALLVSEERYALAAQGANDGLWDWNLRSDEVYFSPRWKAMLGWGEEEAGSDSSEWFGRVHEEDAKRLQLELHRHIEGVTDHFMCEYRIRHRDSSWRWMLSRGLAVRTAEGSAYRMAGSQTDITERKLAEEQLIHDAVHDSLTGLPNRVLFMDRLNQALRRCQRRANYRFAVVFLDLDRFKTINDSLGHLTGDDFLRAIAGKIEQCIRAGDTVARLGGDEFAILLEDLEDEGRVLLLSERIRQTLASPLTMDGREIFTTASVGIAMGSSEYQSAEEILRDADTAMYRAKASGRARHAVFNPEMHARAVELLQMESDLQRALQKEEFAIHYQPIVSLESGRITSMEALVRWNHPNRGIVPPDEFIPIAEETGLVLALDMWVLREACRQTRIWQESLTACGDLSVSVNLSARHFQSPDLFDRVMGVLGETGLAPESLKLEITEGVILENLETTQALLRRLRDRAVRLTIDDFGKGYSSLSYLHRLPIDTLKIDRGFVGEMGVGPRRLEMVRTIVAMAHSLNMDVIAEGVETAEQRAGLHALRCEYAQGYLFSRPLSAPEMEKFIRADPG